MATFTVNPEGHLTLQAEVLKPLGIEPGDQLEFGVLPDGSIRLSERRSALTGTWADVFGCLAGKTDKVATLKEIADASGPEWDPESW